MSDKYNEQDDLNHKEASELTETETNSMDDTNSGENTETHDFREVDSGASDTKNKKKNDNNEYEDVCFVCRRPESKAGRMFKMPNNICVCDDCMHKTMDAVSQFDYQGMLNNPQLMREMDDMNRKGGFPNISFVNLADLQGDGGIPNKQKIKKKKKKF